MTAMNSSVYIHALKDIVNNYNNSKHRVINIEPSNVQKKHEKQIFERMFPKLAKGIKVRKRKFKRGDFVRIAKDRGIFSKEGAPKWSEEVFRVDRLKETVPPYR